MFVPLITVKVDGNDFAKLPRDNRYKRSIENDDVDGDDGGAVEAQSTPRQRRIRKFIRKLPNNIKTNNSLINNNNNNDNTRSDSDINRPRNDNTQPKEIINAEVETPQIKPTRRRIVVPIRRTRLRLAEPQLPSTTPATTTTPAPKVAPKRKMVIMRRRLAPKSPTPAPIVSTILDVVTRPTTKVRTLTFVVTRVHDGHSETISSTSVRQQINTITETITRTQTIDATAVQSTATAPTQSL